jgi:hypothetical protein
MQGFITGTILGVAGGIIGSYLFFKFVIAPKLLNIQIAYNNLRVASTALFKDSSVLLAFQNVFAQRLIDVEEKLDLESLTPEDYKAIQYDVIASIESYAKEPDF